MIVRSKSRKGIARSDEPKLLLETVREIPPAGLNLYLGLLATFSL